MPSTATPDSGDRILVRIALVVLLVLVLTPVFAMALGTPMMVGMGWHDGAMVGMSPWWGVGLWLGWLIVLVAIGYVGYRALVVGSGRSRSTDLALTELRLAYARGDLTDEEFEARRTVLAADRSDEA